MDQAIRLDVLVPRVKVSFLTVDVATLPLGGGVCLADILQPLCVRPVAVHWEGPSSWSCFPLALPEGQGVDVPVMGQFFAFFNTRGHLAITVPAALTPTLLENYRDHVVTGPRDVPGGQMTVFRVSNKLRAKVEMLGHSIELRGGV